MSHDRARRLDRLEVLWRSKPVCTRCYGYAYAIVSVPEGADEDAPEWNPTHCRECGIQLRTVQKIIGISEAEFLGEPADMAG